MINKLTYDQIADCWDLIESGIRSSLPYEISGRHRYRESNVLASLLSGAMECWMSYEKDEENETIILYAIVLGSVFNDEIFGGKYFYIFALFTYRDMPKEKWLEGFKALSKYAKSKGCHMISANTDDSGLIDLAKRLGGSGEYVYITIPLEDEDEVYKL